MATAKSNIAVEKIRAIAQQAYIYGYAPVYVERQRRNLVSVDKVERGVQIAAAQTHLRRTRRKCFDHGLPTAETRLKLYDELALQRATQAVIWSEPASVQRSCTCIALAVHQLTASGGV